MQIIISQTQKQLLTDEGGPNETINRVYTIAGNGEIQNVII